MAEIIIYLIIVFLVALIKVSIGLSQYKSKKPVGFYSGRKPPEEKDLKDMASWNRKHGAMLILYGVLMAVCGLLILVDEIIGAIAMGIEVFGGAGVMIWYHEKLECDYLRKR